VMRDGETYFGSIKDAARATGCPAANIGQCLRGSRRTVHGHTWRLATPVEITANHPRPAAATAGGVR
jgi:hypothetical protein